MPEGGSLGASLVEGRKLKVATVLLNPTANEGTAGIFQLKEKMNIEKCLCDIIGYDML